MFELSLWTWVLFYFISDMFGDNLGCEGVLRQYLCKLSANIEKI